MRTGTILVLATCAFLAGVSQLVSGAPTNDDLPRQPGPYTLQISNFLDLVASGEPEKATEALVNNADMLQEVQKIEGFRPLLDSLRSIPAGCGKYRGFELSSTKELTSRFHRVYVIAHFDKRAILFVFDMYKPNDEWQSRAFSFKSEFEDYIQAFPAKESRRGN